MMALVLLAVLVSALFPWLTRLVPSTLVAIAVVSLLGAYLPLLSSGVTSF